MAKSLYSCPNCGRSVTKVVRKFEKNTMARFFGATMNFNCESCKEELVTGYTSTHGMVIISQREMDEKLRIKRMEAFDPCI